mmetsp:Transcript_40449/g.103593  ORF Transcript_40449/g.103593 Transcript_40449/m.103593 type:complete len:225 (+) Transcript_40449:465-1139(+)
MARTRGPTPPPGAGSAPPPRSATRRGRRAPRAASGPARPFLRRGRCPPAAPPAAPRAPRPQSPLRRAAGSPRGRRPPARTAPTAGTPTAAAPGGRRIAAGAEGGRRPSAAGPRRLPGCPGSQASGQRAGARAVAPAAERRWLWRSAAAWRAAGAAARRGGEGTAGRRAGAAPGGGRRRSGRWAWATWATRRGPRPVCCPPPAGSGSRWAPFAPLAVRRQRVCCC